MRRFDSRIGATLLIALAAIYMVASLALGRSATAEPAPDVSLSASDAGLDVWKSVGAMLEPGALFVDVRSPEEFAAYHVAGSVSIPDAAAAKLHEISNGRAVIVVAAKDDAARMLVGAARMADAKGRYYFLQNGVRDWYLTFELPVALFSDSPAPRGYDEALATVKRFVATNAIEPREPARLALLELAKLNYQPTLLHQSGKPKTAAAGARKKISGGCGG